MSTTTTQPKTDNLITLKGVRLSYAQLFTAKAMVNADGSTGKPKFSATFLLNKKEHAAQIASVEKLIERAAREKFGKKVTLKHKCLRDGNEKEDTEGYGDEVMFIPSTSEQRPAVVDQKKVTIAEQDGKIYSGCYVNAIIQIFAYSHPVGGKGVSASLQAIQLVKDGPSFGATRVNTDTAFEEVETEEDDVSKY